VKPKVLVVYGYDPREMYAFDVGLALAKDRTENFLVERYTGRKDRAVSESDFDNFKRHYKRHLHDFVRRFDARYAIVLHDPNPIPNPLPPEYIHPWSPLAPWVMIIYETRRRLPSTIKEGIRSVNLKHFPKSSLAINFADELTYSPNYMPEEIDEVSLDFLHFLQINSKKAVDFVKDIGLVLMKDPCK
jgi:hypothetical protein